MDLNFTAADVIGTAVLALGVISGYIELKLQVKNLMEANTDKEKRIKSLEQGAITVALLQQTAQRLDDAVEALTSQSVKTSDAMEAVSRSLYRLETQFELEGRHPHRST